MPFIVPNSQVIMRPKQQEEQGPDFGSIFSALGGLMDAGGAASMGALGYGAQQAAAPFMPGNAPLNKASIPSVSPNYEFAPKASIPGKADAFASIPSIYPDQQIARARIPSIPQGPADLGAKASIPGSFKDYQTAGAKIPSLYQQAEKVSYNIKGLRPEIANTIVNAADTAGVDRKLMYSMAGLESQYNPNAASPTGARGLYQFTNRTWNEMVDKYGAQTGITRGMINDPRANATMASYYTKDNQQQLGKLLGREPQPHEIYMAHNLGAGGASRLITADPKTVVSKDLIGSDPRSNPKYLTNKKAPITAGQAINNYRTYVNTGMGVDIQETRVQNSISASGTKDPMEIAQAFLGKDEVRDNKVLAEFFKSSMGQNIDPSKTAWCAAYANAVLQSSGRKGTGSLMAKSFLNYGEPVDVPQKGDIAVFQGNRGPESGHVGFYAGKDKNGNVLILGGNQGNRVSISPHSTKNLLGYRRPPLAPQTQGN